jgi:hypothetical protein
MVPVVLPGSVTTTVTITVTTTVTIKSSQVKCIYMGTTQRFPAPVLAWMQVPNTVVRVR